MPKQEMWKCFWSQSKLRKVTNPKLQTGGGPSCKLGKPTMSDTSEKMPVHKSDMWSREIWLAKIKKSDSPICLQKGGETGGWESEGRSDLVKFFKWFQNGRIWNSYMTESNSVELFNVEFFLTEKLTLKVEIPLFEGFVHPSDFPKSGGDPV